MKEIKNLLIGGLLLAALAAGAQPFQSRSFLLPYVAGFSSSGTQAWGGITISNAAAAPLGGFTNLLSWNNSTTAPLVQGTNCPNLTWTNNSGIWVIPTNGVPGTVTGIQFLQGPDSTALVQDVSLWTDRNGQIPITITTNNWTGDNVAYPLSGVNLVCRTFGAASAATTLNLTFVGLPDGTNEPTTSVSGAAPVFVWGITPIAGAQVLTTNFPIWKFAGCSKVRLRTAVLTTTSAANIGVTIQSLRLNGYVP